MKRRLLVLTLVVAVAAVALAQDAPTQVPAYQGPDMTLTLDKLAGSFTFWRQTDDGYENGFLELQIDHTWKLVTDLDRDRDRVADEHHVQKGEYGVARRADGTVGVWMTDEAGQRLYLADLRIVGGRARSFSVLGRAFTRRGENEPYFVIEHNRLDLAAELFVETEPAGAAVFIDGFRIEGVTPLSIKKPQAGTPLTILVAKPEFQPITETVTLQVEETRRLEFKLVQGESGLEITSVPWVKVRLDGEFLGVTPLKADGIAAGPHEIELYNEALELSRREKIVLDKGKFLTKHFAFNGRLIIDVGRPCTILRRGKTAGNAPFDEAVPIGRHNLVLVDAKGNRRRLLVQVNLDETVRVEKSFDSLPRAD